MQGPEEAEDDGVVARYVSAVLARLMSQPVVDVQGQELGALVVVTLVVEDLLEGLLLRRLQNCSAFKAV